jgi:dATP pyrophosphohydrolase
VSRAPFQVLVFPFRILSDDEIVYAVFRRPDDGTYWQAISGGGENDETPLEAAKREAWEEAGITPGNRYMKLDSLATIPIVHFAPFRDRQDIHVIPEYSFGVAVADAELTLSPEHLEYAWLPYQDALAILRWDSNRNALWELDRRLRASLGSRRSGDSST